MTAAQPSKWECPQCKQIDQVQRVSAIVKAGTTTGTLTGTTTGGSADISHLLARDSQTLLSKLLASPKKPNRLSWSYWQQPLVRGVVVILLIIGVSALIIQMIIKYTGALRDSQDAAIAQGIIIVIGLVALLIAAYSNNNIGTYKSLRKKWKQTYYCHRCDRFFVPIEPPQNPGVLRKLLIRLKLQKPQQPVKPEPIAPEDMQRWLRARKWKSK